MKTQNERFHMFIDSETKLALQQAAAINRVSVAEFIRRSARKEADKAIKKAASHG